MTHVKRFGSRSYIGPQNWITLLAVNLNEGTINCFIKICSCGLDFALTLVRDYGNFNIRRSRAPKGNHLVSNIKALVSKAKQFGRLTHRRHPRDNRPRCGLPSQFPAPNSSSLDCDSVHELSGRNNHLELLIATLTSHRQKMHYPESQERSHDTRRGIGNGPPWRRRSRTQQSRLTANLDFCACPNRNNR